MSDSINLVHCYLNTSDELSEQNIVTTDLISQTETISHDKNSENKKKISHWTKEEHLKYLQFCKQYSYLLNNVKERRKIQIFIQMADYIGTRDHIQCKSHHQKYFQKEKKSIKPQQPIYTSERTQKMPDNMEFNISNGYLQNNMVNLLFVNVPSWLAQVLQQNYISLENKLEEVDKAQNLMNQCFNCQYSQPSQYLWNEYNQYLQKQQYQNQYNYQNQINQVFSNLSSESSYEESSMNQISNFLSNQQVEPSCNKLSTPKLKKQNLKKQQQSNNKSSSEVKVKKVKKIIVKSKQ